MMLMVVPAGKLYFTAIPPPTIEFDAMTTVNGGVTDGTVDEYPKIEIDVPNTNVEPTMLIVHVGIAVSIVVRSKTRLPVMT